MVSRIATQRALIIVDVQEDFVEGGSLAVAGGREVARKIAEELLVDGHPYDFIVTTQDWHIDPGSHFSETPDFVSSWPVHCVAGTEGAKILEPIERRLDELKTPREVIRKGQFEDAYSGFMGRTLTGIPLAEILKSRAIGAVDVVGIATDYCVAATAMDSAGEGFDTRVLTKYAAAINPERVQSLIESEFPQVGVSVA